QVVGIANSALNSANCSEAPDCTALGRYECGRNGQRQTNTCGECLVNFVGVSGQGNTLCTAESDLVESCSNGVVDEGETDIDCGGYSCPPCPSGSSCSVGTDCLYGSCVSSVLPSLSESGNGTCDPVPSKACPNSCGGEAQGSCTYIDPNSRLLESNACTAEDPLSTCRAVCECAAGYEGDYCQYSEEELAAAKGIRRVSLGGLSEALTALDLSTTTLGQQATLLSQVCVCCDPKQSRG
ncbi:unnamed protein product, partial [Choristocarpus tenellus]